MKTLTQWHTAEWLQVAVYVKTTDSDHYNLNFFVVCYKPGLCHCPFFIQRQELLDANV